MQEKSEELETKNAEDLNVLEQDYSSRSMEMVQRREQVFKIREAQIQRKLTELHHREQHLEQQEKSAVDLRRQLQMLIEQHQHTHELMTQEVGKTKAALEKRVRIYDHRCIMLTYMYIGG